MDRNAILLPQSAIGRQREAIEKLRGLLAQEHTPPLAYVQTYGCQQNVADSQPAAYGDAPGDGLRLY